MPEATHVTITYEGEPVRAGSMDVHEFAPALLGLGDLLRIANRTVNHNSADLNVRIVAELRRGSFGFDLNLIQTVQANASLFGIQDVETVVRLVFGGGGAVGLIGLLLKLRRKKPEAVTPQANNNVNVTVKDNTGNVTVVVPNSVFQLYESPAARNAVDRAVRPLEQSGMERLKVESPREESPRTIEASDVPYLLTEREPPKGDVLHSSESEGFYEVVTAQFYAGYKWRLKQGKVKFTVNVEDADFLDRVARGMERFGRGDILRVSLRTTIRKRIGGDGLDPEYAVTRVLEVIHPDDARLAPKLF